MAKSLKKPHSLLRSKIRANMRKAAKSVKKQEVKQYPPRYTTSKPKPPQDMITTYKPKLNLSHIQEPPQPKPIPPSENTRRLALSAPSNKRSNKQKGVPREEKTDYSMGVIKGIESDHFVRSEELELYRKALEVLKKRNTLKYLPKRTTAVKTTTGIVKEVGHLVPGRLTT